MAVDRSSPGFTVRVLTNTQELRVRGNTDSRTLAKELAFEDLTHRIEKFTYEDSEREFDILKLEIHNQDLYFLDHPYWVKGNLIEFAFGYEGQASPKRYAVVDNVSGFDRLRVTCVEQTALSNVAKSGIFKNLTRADVVRKMVSEGRFAGVTATSIQEVPEEKPDDHPQAKQTDYAFLLKLAEPLGYEVYVERGVLHFHERRFDLPSVEIYEHYYGRGDLLEFKIDEWAVISRAGETVVASRDPLERKNRVAAGSNKNTERTVLGNQGSIVLKATKESGGALQVFQSAVIGALGPLGPSVASAISARTVNPSPTPDEGGIKREADAKFRKQEQDEIKATAKIVGNPILSARSIITIRGISKQLSGRWYIKKHVHEISKSGYVGTLTVIRNALTAVPTQDPPTLDGEKAKENTQGNAGERELILVRDRDGALIQKRVGAN